MSKSTQVQSEVAGFAVCRSSHVLFTILLDERGEDELVERATYLIASYCLINNFNLEDLQILMLPSKTFSDYLGNKIQEMQESIKSISGPSPIQVSNRERQVLHKLFDGLRNKEIANALHISERTVKFHVSALLAKYAVPDRFALAEKFRRLSTIEVTSSKEAV